MQSPWLLAYLASKQREEDVKKAAERHEQVRQARQAQRDRRRNRTE